MSVPIEKELDNAKAFKYKIKIDSFRSMPSSLLNAFDNLSKGLDDDKCTDCKSYLFHMSIKNYQLAFKCFDCKRNYNKDFNQELIKNLKTYMNFVTETLIYLFCY